MNESVLVARAAAGEASAFGALVRAHQSKLRGFLARLARGDHALADDLAQDTFVEAYRKIAQFRGEGSFAGWLYRIAYRQFLMHLRRRGVSPEIAEPEDSACDESAALAKLDVTRAMARLSPAERAALTLCYALGFSNEDAASILNLPLGTVKSHVLRGREKLKVLLDSWSGEVGHG
jgi:RNA polymerase sigma-70 factor, ECF subfamily